MAKQYLDTHGVDLLWAKIKTTFANKKTISDELTELGKSITKLDGTVTENKKDTESKITSIDKKQSALSNEFYRVKDEVLETGEASDTFIHVEDSAMAEYQELSVDGVCEQVTTTGKNLIKSNLLPITKNGITISENDNGDIVVNGTITGIESGYVTFTIGDTFTIEEGTYTSSVQNKKEGIGLNTGGFYGALNITMADNVNFKTATATETRTITPQINIRYDAGTFNNYIFNPMLEKSSTANEYEPYTGGQPSPSPDYPQEIKTITDSLIVTSCNKNVFKITSPLKHSINSGVDISINDNVITLNGTATGTMWPDFIWGIQTNTVTHNKCKYYFSEQPEDCIVSINVLSGTATGGSFVIIANDDGSSTFGLKFSNSQGTITHKANGVNRAYLSGIVSGTKFDNFTFEIMLEKGSVATAFERHIESQIQAKLPEGEFIGKIDDTYKDTLKVEYNEEDGQYHLNLYKNVGKVVLDGSDDENWQISTIVEKTNTCYLSCNVIDGLNNGNNAISTHFINILDLWNIDIEGFMLTTDSQRNIRLRINKTTASDVTTFKTWLNENNVEVYYALATPYVVDLGVVDMPITYNEVTNLFTDSDLMPTINAKYYRNFISTIRNLQVNEKALKQELIDINTRLSALESATTNVTSESEVVE